MKKFDIVKDNELIATGSHFWCSGHLSAVPVGERSHQDERYCLACYQIIKAESRRDTDSGRWTGNGFILGKTLWTVSPTGGVVGGPVSGGGDDALAADQGVQKLADDKTDGENPAAIQTGVIIALKKRAPGRPRLPDSAPVSRRTFYYRRKEVQAVLL